MPDVINQPLYSPVGVQPFSQIRPFAPADLSSATDLFNSELQAISDAFQQIYALPVVTTDTYLSENVRNALVDLSALADTDTGIGIYLPQSPNLGDPPCIVIVQESGYQTAGSPNLEAVAIITTNDGTYINGLEQSIANADQVTLYNPGDIAICTFVGGDIGWSINTNLSVVANPNGGMTSPALGAAISPGQEYFFDAGATITALAQVSGLGQWFAVTKAGTNVVLGDSTFSFNGVAGPYTISTNYRRYLFVAQGSNHFTVTHG